MKTNRIEFSGPAPVATRGTAARATASWRAAALCLFCLNVVRSATLAAALLLAPMARSEIAEPDNVLYGTITLDNAPVTAARTDVTVEARRAINGPALASYRMGTNPRIGNFYSLELPLESLPPATDPAASQTGDSLIIVVTDSSGVRGQTTYVLGERGNVQRVDFGAAAADSDGDTLPDAWELLHFGSLVQDGDSVAANGATVRHNFVAGSDPASTNDLFTLHLVVSNNQQIVSFLALRADGTGYEGRSRFYALERSVGSPAGSWLGVPNFTNLPGNNQLLIYQAAATNSPLFFRGRVWLEP